MKLRHLAAIMLPGLMALACSRPAPQDNLTQYVDLKLGSGGHGHVFVGANVPNGMVQLGPTSIPQSWDWCSGYHESDSTVIGFSHTHLSGTGIGDLFDITVMPVTGEVKYARGREDDPASGLWSYADRTKETARPGYYKVFLTRYGIDAEMTATNRVGFHRYTFPATDDAAIVIDLQNGGCWDRATKTEIVPVKNADGKIVAIDGKRFSSGWAKDQRVWFHAELETPAESAEIIDATMPDFPGRVRRPANMPEPDLSQRFVRLNYGKVAEGTKILMKVSLSPSGNEGAKANMAAELPGWDFDATAKAADKAWNDALKCITIETGDADARTIFYSALFHVMVHPATFSDVNEPHDYTIYSLWDTYRAFHPLLTLCRQDMVPDLVNSMLKIYDKQGRLPVWHLWGNETDCMAGNPGVIVVGDAIVKGFEGFDKEKAFEAMKNTVMADNRGQDIRKKYGFIPSDLYNESVANDMEYAIADAAVANAAAYLGKTEDAEFFRNRSHSYRNYMDHETLLARGRLSDGSWRTPFDPFVSNHRVQDYMEGTAWQYTWLMPHDYEGLVDFYGSRDKFVERLDTLFAVSSEIKGENASPDISGLIGQYAHGNEPSHHIIYFYSMAGRRDKAAEKVREVLNTMYLLGPGGLCGNEDEGEMSAWYVLSSLGIFEPEPASTKFWFGSPIFDKASISVPGGTFTIKAVNNSAENIYIQSATLNGKPCEHNYIEFSDIKAGGELVFTMGPKPIAE